jgi:Ca2+-binding RTX toxin-like protein
MDLGDGNDVASNETDLASNPSPVGGVTGTTGIRGGPGDDVLNGGTNTDLLIGDEGADTLNGNGGPDHLREGRDAASTDVRDKDIFNGGPGTDDRASYASATAGVAVDLDGVADDGRKADAQNPVEGDDVNADIEDIEGGGGRDELRGDADDNTIRGGGENDELVGNLGDDVLDGQLGSDLLMEGVGAANVDPLDGDIFAGFLGSFDTGSVDAVSYQGATVCVIVDIDGAADDGRVGEGDNARADLEDVVGGGPTTSSPATPKTTTCSGSGARTPSTGPREMTSSGATTASTCSTEAPASTTATSVGRFPLTGAARSPVRRDDRPALVSFRARRSRPGGRRPTAC